MERLIFYSIFTLLFPLFTQAFDQNDKYFVEIRMGYMPAGKSYNNYALHAGYKWDMFYLMGGYELGNADWGNIRATARPDELSSSTDESATNSKSELNRSRKPTDTWSFTNYKVGIGMNGFLYKKQKYFSEIMNCYLISTKMKDQANSIPFSGYLLSWEAGGSYYLAPNRNLTLLLNYVTGTINTSDDIRNQMGHQAVNYLTLTLGLNFWL
jgi:hypothetical protein